MKEIATIEKILTSPDFVLAEVDRLQQIYALKAEIRYGQRRKEELMTESVAEHIFGMQVAAAYFLPLEDQKRQWDYFKINQMILWHDLDEIITGDIIGYLKTDKHRVAEQHAKETVLANLPEHLITEVTILLREYDERATAEARFVKAIDKLEPSIQCFCENGKQTFLDKHTTLAEHNRIKDPYFVDFPIIKRFSDILTKDMIDQGFFTEPA